MTARSADVCAPLAPLRIAGRLLRTSLLATEALGDLRFAVARFPGGDPVRRARLLSSVCARALELHGVRVHADGELPHRPAVLVCNHVSYLDPLVVMAALPSLPVAKAEVRGWPLLGGLLSRLGVQFVRRNNAMSGASVIQWMVRTLGDGASVLSFPEGTTSEGRAVLPFRPGSFGAARHADVCVVPIAIRYGPADLAWTGDASFLPHYLRFASRDATDVHLRIGDPLRTSRFTTDLELARRAQSDVAALLSGSHAWASSARSSTSRAA